MKTSILIVAAGKGERFGQPKMELKLAGKTLLERCRETVEQLPFENELIVVGPAEGGETRFESVKNGLMKCTCDIVIIHNVANPMATVEDFVRVHEMLIKQDAGVFVGQRVVDTLRRLDDRSETIDRNNVWRVQTPQGFHTGTLKKLVVEVKTDITDEVQLYEQAGLPVIGLETTPLNQKITYPSDLEFLEQHLRKEILVGVGEDSHYFDNSGTMTIGGLELRELPKLHARSDGDVILHALFNAISSAMGDGSIGQTADPMVEQGIIDSSKYLDVILKEMSGKRFRLSNVSISLECSVPKIDPLVPAMKEALALLLTLSPEKIGITATSGEALSAFGKGEGIRCSCIVSLAR